MTLATLLPMTTAIPIALVLLVLSFILLTLRFILGPSLADRIVVMDTFGILAVVSIALYVMHHQQQVLLPVAFVVALFSFLGTVAFSRYLEELGVQENHERELEDGNSE